MMSLGLSKAVLSQKSQVDERTIQRWLDGARPQFQNARRVADYLECEPGELWPDIYPSLNPPSAGTIAVSVYTSRAHIPIDVWKSLFSSAQSLIDICVYGGTFLFDTVPGFNRQIQDAAERGVEVRFIAGDPDSPEVFRRGEEELIGSNLAGRCSLTLSRLRPLANVSRIQIRTHSTPLYTSMFRVDDTMIANHHVYGSPASDNPALVLTHESAPDLWDKYISSFERIWSVGSPAFPSTSEGTA